MSIPIFITNIRVTIPGKHRNYQLVLVLRWEWIKRISPRKMNVDSLKLFPIFKLTYFAILCNPTEINIFDFGYFQFFDCLNPGFKEIFVLVSTDLPNTKPEAHT